MRIKTPTSTYSAQMSMLPTKLHTCSTVQEFISSVRAWHRRWLCAGDASAAVENSLLLPQLVFGCWTVVGDGDAVLRFGLCDSNFKRFATFGVDALKSNGDDALVRLLFDVEANVWLIDGAAAVAAADDDDDDAKNGWLFSSEFAFCCSDNNWNVFGMFADNGIRFCGDVVVFDGGDCCERNGFVWIGGVCRLFSRFCGPFIKFFISLSFAACAWNVDTIIFW